MHRCRAFSCDTNYSAFALYRIRKDVVLVIQKRRNEGLKSMSNRKVIKVTLSASRLNLDRVAYSTFDFTRNEVVGMATLKASSKELSMEEIELASEFIMHQLERETDYVNHVVERDNTFVFKLKDKVDVLEFIRDFRKECMKYSDCDYTKLEFKFQ